MSKRTSIGEKKRSSDRLRAVNGTTTLTEATIKTKT
jgi:hypothetical protein